MVYSNLAESILLAPAENGANQLCILTKNATPNMVSWLLKNLMKITKIPISVNLIINTMMTDGICISSHESFKELHSFVTSFICSYIYEPIMFNSTLYIWLKNAIPIVAYASSDDFEQASFFERDYGNISEYNVQNALQQYRTAESSSIYCHHSEIEENIKIFQTLSSTSDLVKFNSDSSDNRSNEVILSLVTNKTGEPGDHSGLNWGQRKGRNPNQAYIPLPSKIAKSGFFPVEPINSPPHFTVITDDKHQLILRIEQQNQKAIATPLSNAQLGEYFRNRMDLAYGAYVTREDLERYGRTDVKFIKIDSEHYYMDFSV